SERRRVQDPARGRGGYVRRVSLGLVPRGAASHERPALQHRDVVLLDGQSGPLPSPGQGQGTMSRSDQDRRNEYNRALYVLMAKLRCRGQALSCFLDEQPSALVPRHARDVTHAQDLEGSLVVNPSFRYAPRGELPPELRDRRPLVDGFLKGFPLAWIEDAGTGIWTPLWAR